MRDFSGGTNILPVNLQTCVAAHLDSSFRQNDGLTFPLHQGEPLFSPSPYLERGPGGEEGNSVSSFFLR